MKMAHLLLRYAQPSPFDVGLMDQSGVLHLDHFDPPGAEFGEPNAGEK